MLDLQSGEAAVEAIFLVHVGEISARLAGLDQDQRQLGKLDREKLHN